MENKTDIIIIGAGICGLFAARELSGKGKKVRIIEATEKAGGRIRALDAPFSRMMDEGPEFIHGDLPITKALVKEAGGKLREQKGEFYRSENGTIVESDDLLKGWDELIKKLKSVEEDLPLSEFLAICFDESTDKKLINAVKRLAEGFDAANADRISTFAVRDEWAGDSIEESYQIEGGYSLLVDFLRKECEKNGCIFHFNTVVKTINWENEFVQITCAGAEVFETPQVVITVSLGVLLSTEKERGNIQFMPHILHKIAAAKKMGFGPVIKINMEFKTAFWNDPEYAGKAAQLPGLRFLNSDGEFPAWWTKEPASPFLIGWVGGSPAEKMQHLSDDELFEKAIASLSYAVNTSPELIRDLIVAHCVSNWGVNPFTKGAYSYQTPETHLVKKVLAEPLGHKVFFAGEALGENMGTVEAALESAKAVVKQLEK